MSPSCPFVALPSDWDAYLTKLSANNRQKVRRWLRKVEAGEEYDIAASISCLAFGRPNGRIARAPEPMTSPNIIAPC